MTKAKTIYDGGHLSISDDLSLMKYGEIRIMFADTPQKAAGICLAILCDKYERKGENLYKFTKFPRPITMETSEIRRELIVAFLKGYLNAKGYMTLKGRRDNKSSVNKAVKAARKVYGHPAFQKELEEVTKEFLDIYGDPFIYVLTHIA